MLGRKSFLIMLSKLISAALAYAGVFFISRYLTRDVYGSILFTSFLIATFNSIADLGLSNAHQKRVSEGKDLSDCLSTFIVSKLVLMGLTIVITVSSLFLWSQVLRETLQSTSVVLLGVFILYYIFLDLATIATATFDARQETAKSQSSLIIEPLIRTPLVIFVALGGMGENELALAYMIGGLATFLTAMALLHREHIPLKRPTLFQSYISFMIPLVFMVITYTLFTNLPTLVVGMFWGSGQVGLYALPLAILNLFAVVGTAVATLTFPEFSRLYGEGNLDEMKSTTRRAERYIVMITLPVIVVLALFPTQAVLIFFGPEYELAGGPFRFLVISTFLLILTNVYSSHIVAANRPDLSAKLMFISLIILAALMFILVPTSIAGFPLFGMASTGAAIATMTATGFYLVMTRITVSRLTGARASKRMLFQIPAAAISATILLALNMVWPVSHWNDLIGFVLISYAVSAGFLYLVKDLTRDDIDFFLSVVSLREMKQYIASELGGNNSLK